MDGDVVVRAFGRLEIGSGLAISGIPVATHVVVGPRGVLRIGRRVRIAHGVSISAYGEVIIGDDVVIGPLAIVMDTDYHDRHQHDVSRTPRPVRIGDGVRLGAGVVVLRGAVIAEGARVTAHSVASRYVPPRTIARGVPARPISGG